MVETIKSITQKTAIPIAFALALGVFACHISWGAAKIESKVESNSVKIERHETEMKEILNGINYLEKAMVRIETKLSTLPSNYKKEK